MKIRFDRLIIATSAFAMAISTAAAQQQDDQTAQQHDEQTAHEEETVENTRPFERLTDDRQDSADQGIDNEPVTSANTQAEEQSLQELAEQNPDELKGEKLYSAEYEELGEIQSIVRHSESGELHAVIARGESAEEMEETAIPLSELAREDDRIVFSSEENASQALQEWSYDESQFEEVSTPA